MTTTRRNPANAFRTIWNSLDDTATLLSHDDDDDDECTRKPTLLLPRNVFLMAKDLAFASGCRTRSCLSSSWAPDSRRATTAPTAASASRSFVVSRPHRTAVAVAIDRGHQRQAPTALLLLAASSGLMRGIASMALKGRRLKTPRWGSIFKRARLHQADRATAPSTAQAQAQAPVEVAVQCLALPLVLQRPGWLRWRAACAAPASEAMLAVRQSGWARPAHCFLKARSVNMQ